MENQNEVVINEKSMEILVAKFIPTSQYFERSFEMLQRQLEEQRLDQKELKIDMDKRFEKADANLNEFKEDVSKRFEQVDKRFEQVDKRFEQVDERFKEIEKSIVDVNISIQEMSKNMEITIRDHIIDRDRLFDSKLTNLRMFNIATISLVAGVILKMAGILHI
ncbi:MAG: hypothetical protein U9N02_03930 [Campylobacterota bacterium]|nr:hypothetical protein [Campylobacterota bacterium]